MTTPIFLILLLGACSLGPAAPTRYDPPPKPGGRLCIAQCQDAKVHGNDVCKLQQRACTNDMQEQAMKDYDRYTREQFETRQPVELRPSDFERPETCLPKDCLHRCTEMYNRCYENCGGTVTRGVDPEPTTGVWE